MDTFILDCQKNDIQLIWVYSPIYVKGQKVTQNRNEIFTFYKETSSKYNIPLLDYSNHHISQSTDYFSDATHLNKKGAELFSKEFTASLKISLETKQDK